MHTTQLTFLPDDYDFSVNKDYSRWSSLDVTAEIPSTESLLKTGSSPNVVILISDVKINEVLIDDRHIIIGQLWIQERLAHKDIGLGNVLGTEKPADLLTKHLPRETMAKHLSFSGLIVRDGRAEAGLKTASI